MRWNKVSIKDMDLIAIIDLSRFEYFLDIAKVKTNIVKPQKNVIFQLQYSMSTEML